MASSTTLRTGFCQFTNHNEQIQEFTNSRTNFSTFTNSRAISLPFTNHERNRFHEFTNDFSHFHEFTNEKMLIPACTNTAGGLGLGGSKKCLSPISRSNSHSMHRKFRFLKIGSKNPYKKAKQIRSKTCFLAQNKPQCLCVCSYMVKTNTPKYQFFV